MGLFNFFKKNKPENKEKYNNDIRMYQYEAENDLRIMKDCAEIMHSTVNKDTFKLRLELFEEKARHLKSIEQYINFDGASPTEIVEALERDKEMIIKEFESKPAVHYFENMEKVQVQWSVISNLKAFNSSQANDFENMCKENICQYKSYIDLVDTEECFVPKNVPAYIRLAMLYEKQKRFVEGIDVCVDAIKCGAYEDGTKGKMYGRLARLIKKSGIEVDDDILALAMNRQGKD